MPEHVTFLVPGFPHDEKDVNCLPAVQNFVRAFHRAYPDVQIEVFAFQYPLDAGTYRWHGIRVTSAGGDNRGAARKLRTWWRICRSVDVPRGSVLHSFWIGECTLIASLLAQLRGCRHVATIGGQELRKRTVYARVLSRRSFVLTAGSEMASETARRILGRPADTVIPLGLDVEFAAAGRFEGATTGSGAPIDEYAVPIVRGADKDAGRPIDVLTVGSLIPVKRTVDVLAVARRLPRPTFLIAGDGPERARLLQSAPANVTLLGELPRTMVLDLMRRSKILLHPSEFESQGYVFLEALASGMHVVCRDVGAPGATAHVHRCHSTTEMAEAVRGILRSETTFRAVPVPTAMESAKAYADVYERASVYEGT